MAISYRPLWIQLATKVYKNRCYKKANLTTNVMARMGKNKTISFKNLEKICTALRCSPNDVFEFVEESEF